MVFNDYDGGVGSSAGVLPGHQAILYGGSGKREESAVMHMLENCASLGLVGCDLAEFILRLTPAYVFLRRRIICYQLYNTMSWHVGFEI